MPTPDLPDRPVEWRQLDKRLWVARAAGEPLGMIQRGRRYVVTDSSDRVRGDFGTMAEARAALDPHGSQRLAERPLSQGRLVVLGASACGVVAALMAAFGLVRFV